MFASLATLARSQSIPINLISVLTETLGDEEIPAENRLFAGGSGQSLGGFLF